MANYLYMLRSLAGSGRNIKVGVTKNPKARFKQLKVGIQTELVVVVRNGNHRQHEKRLHKKLKAHRLPQSEWFELDDAQQKELADEIKALDGLDLDKESDLPTKKSSKSQKQTEPPADPELLRQVSLQLEAKKKLEEREARIKNRKLCESLLAEKEKEDYESFEDFWTFGEGNEALQYLELFNPWIEHIHRPVLEECEVVDGEVRGMCVTISAYQPDQDDGYLGFVNLYPVEGAEDGIVEIDADHWLYQRHGRNPKDFEELCEWFSLMKSLPVDSWPSEALKASVRLEQNPDEPVRQLLGLPVE